MANRRVLSSGEKEGPSAVGEFSPLGDSARLLQTYVLCVSLLPSIMI